MKIAVASMGTSLDAWAGASFGLCSQFVVVDTETMASVVIAVPSEQQDPHQASLYAIRALAAQGVEAVVCGQIEEMCRQALFALGVEVVEGVERVTVRQAAETYRAAGAQGLSDYAPPPVRIAVASHGADLDATLSPQGEPCTSFVLVEPQTMHGVTSTRPVLTSRVDFRRRRLRIFLRWRAPFPRRFKRTGFPVPSTVTIRHLHGVRLARAGLVLSAPSRLALRIGGATV